MKTKKIKVKGMHCKSCEETIERCVLKVNGVKTCKADCAKAMVRVSFDERKTDIEEIKKKIEEKGYECEGYISRDGFTRSFVKSGRKSYIKNTILIFALLTILFGGYQIAQGFAFFDLPTVGEPVSLVLLFGIGLLTGFHCVGMCGGFVMSYTTKNAMNGKKDLHIPSHVKYGTGKLISYTAIGALFGLIGTIFVFTPLLRGTVSIFAGIFLILFGLNTLNVIPTLRRLSIPIPKAFTRFVIAKSDREHRPFVTGLLNGLMIACGPLQALYIYAAGTGSVAQGALALFAFGLGTLPVMFGFGMFASYVSKNMTRNILKFSGLIVIMLGVIMLNRGLALMGTGYDFNNIVSSLVPYTSGNFGGENIDNVKTAANETFQEIRMNVTRYGWEPDRFVLKASVPVKWIINGKEITNCNKAIQVPSLGLSFDVKPGEQIIEFTPPNEDTTIPWSCWMGMIQGTFIVKKNIDINNQQEIQNELEKISQPKTIGRSCGSGGCRCGCGGAR